MQLQHYTDTAVSERGDGALETDWLAETLPVFDALDRAGINYIRLRFEIGRRVEEAPQRIVQTERGQRLEGRVPAAMRLLKDHVGYNQDWFYDSHTLYRHFETPDRLEGYLREAVEEKGLKPTWTLVREAFRPSTVAVRAEEQEDPVREQQRSELAEAERLAYASERAVERARQYGDSEEADGLGAAIAALRHEVLSEIRRADEFKPKTFRSDAYLDFVRALPCYVTGGPAVPCHIGTAGKGLKASDAMAVPLCDEIHRYQHQHGFRAAEQKYGFSYIEALADTLHRFVADQAAEIPHELSR